MDTRIPLASMQWTNLARDIRTASNCDKDGSKCGHFIRDLPTTETPRSLPWQARLAIPTCSAPCLQHLDEEKCTTILSHFASRQSETMQKIISANKCTKIWRLAALRRSAITSTGLNIFHLLLKSKTLGPAGSNNCLPLQMTTASVARQHLTVQKHNPENYHTNDSSDGYQAVHQNVARNTNQMHRLKCSVVLLCAVGVSWNPNWQLRTHTRTINSCWNVKLAVIANWLIILGLHIKRHWTCTLIIWSGTPQHGLDIIGGKSFTR